MVRNACRSGSGAGGWFAAVKWSEEPVVKLGVEHSDAHAVASESDIGLLEDQGPVFGDPPSDATVRRCLTGLDPVVSGKVAKARAKARQRVWDLIAGRAGGFPWLLVECACPGS